MGCPICGTHENHPHFTRDNLTFCEENIRASQKKNKAAQERRSRPAVITAVHVYGNIYRIGPGSIG